MASDINSIVVGETWRSFGMVAKASGDAITSGTVNYYLKCLTGTNAGKYWDGNSWETGAQANAMTHQGDGLWTVELGASPFTDGVMYAEWAKESGDLHVAGEGRLLRGVPVNTVVNVVQWRGSTPALLIETDKLQVSVQHIADGLVGSTSDIANAAADATRTELATELGRIDVAVSTLATAASLASLAGKFTGITLLANWLRGMVRKDAMDATAKSELNTSGGTFDETTDSIEAIRDTAPLGTAMRGTDGANTVAPLDAAGTRDALGMAAANLDLQIANIEGGSGGGTGIGARTVTITVNDGTNALESAKVRLTKGAETYVSTTNTSGQITFNIDDGTWTVAISLVGHTYAGTTLVVDGDEAVTYSMTQTTFTASDPGFVTGYCYAKNTAGVAVEGAEVHLQMESPLSTSSGTVWDGAIRTVTSDANGLVEFTNMVPGATYRVRRGDGNWQELDVASDATDPLALPDFVGEDS